MNWDDLQLKQNYGSFKAYIQSKLANVLFTKYLAKKLEGEFPIDMFIKFTFDSLQSENLQYFLSLNVSINKE